MYDQSKYMSHRQIKRKLFMEWIDISLWAISNYRKQLNVDKEITKEPKEIVIAKNQWHLPSSRSVETKIDYKQENWELSVSKNNRIKSLDDLIQHCEIDLNTREIDRHVINKWEVWAKDQETGKIITEPLYQVKAWIKKKKEMSQRQMDNDTIEKLWMLWKNYHQNDINKSDYPLIWNKLLEVCIFDAHINKLCIAEKSWNEWNHIIAKEVYLDMIKSMLERWKQEWCNRVCFIVWNDFFQTDTLQQTTTKWTRVDASTLLYPAFTLWQEIIIESIWILRELWEVDVVMIWWNHDKASAFYLGQVLSARYRLVDWVTIDISIKSRKYYRFGRNMIMFAHGDWEKLKDLNSIMAIEQPSMRSNARFREVHLGHYHTQRVYEQHWVIVRYMNSISWTDAWHEENWYIWNIRWWTAFVRSLNEWLSWQFTFNI